MKKGKEKTMHIVVFKHIIELTVLGTGNRKTAVALSTMACVVKTTVLVIFLMPYFYFSELVLMKA